jgi:hypothetical protein
VEEKQLFDYYYGKGERLEILSRLHSANPNSLLVCAIYAQELSIDAQENPDARAKLPEALANGRRIDPSNPLYDYLECLMLMREGCMMLRAVDIPVDEIKMEEPVKPDGTIAFYLGAITPEGRGKLDEAITVYRKGLSKGNIDTYGDELRRRIRGMLEIRGDLLGGMQLINFRSRERLLFLPSFRCIANGVPVIQGDMDAGLDFAGEDAFDLVVLNHTLQEIRRPDILLGNIVRAGKRAAGSVAASDAFFPFEDGPQILIDAGVRAIVQPGGSMRDELTVQACEDAGVTMYLTGTRHFFH